MATLHLALGRVEHAVLPPHDDGFTSASDAWSVGVSFTGHRDVVVRDGSGRARGRSVAPGGVGVAGRADLTWERTAERSESVELHPDPGLLRRIGGEHGIRWDERDEYLHLPPDPVSWAAAHRLRAAATGAAPLDALEAEELVLRWLGHLARAHLGGRARPVRGVLDPARLRAVTDHVEEHLVAGPTLAQLAAVASMSPFHFLRVFRRTTGLTPHAYVTAVRVERAHRLLVDGGRTVAEAAAAVGVADTADFRRLHRRAFGRSPRG